MSEIIYRQVQKKDYPRIRELIDEAWHFDQFTDTNKTKTQMLEIYMRNCLNDQTFTRVAEEDGKVVGLIFGRSDAAAKKFKLTLHHLAIFKSVIRLCFSDEAKANAKEYRKFSAAYKSLIAGKESRFDGELVLFIVDSTCQGKGIGKELVEHFKSYMKQTHTQCIYLYTDTQCNYGFYDHQGFERIDERRVEVKTLKGILKMGVYLYSFSLL